MQAGWPRSFAATGVAFEVHEPQVQRWDGAVLVADAAVVAHPDGQRQPVPGVVRMTARTVVDKAAGTVAVDDLTLTDASFPAARDREPAWLALLRNFAPRSVKRLSLAHLEASARQAKRIAQGRDGRASGGASHHRGQEPRAAGRHRWRAALRRAAGDQAARSAQHPRGAAQGPGRQAVPARVQRLAERDVAARTVDHRRRAAGSAAGAAGGPGERAREPADRQAQRKDRQAAHADQEQRAADRREHCSPRSWSASAASRSSRRFRAPAWSM